jgi:arsenate reductase
MKTFPVVIHHNPNCSTSRQVLAMAREAGIEPVVVEYLKTGWTRGQLQALFAAAGITARAALRDKEAIAAELGLLDPGVDESKLLDAMISHPILVNRPIVATPLGVALCRPADRARALLSPAPTSQRAL